MSTPERERLMGELRQTVQRGTMYAVLLHHAMASRAGVNVTDAQCLNLLVLDGPQSPGQLARAMGVTTGGAITAVIDRLEEAGYVKRTRDPDDRRRVVVEPVPESMAGFAASFEPAARDFAQHADEFSEAELDLLVRWWERANRTMPEVIQRIRDLPR